jgi:pimeloyl-ACP methyl ester carboxylesterase
VISGTYTVTPLKAGYTFSPLSRQVIVPPDASGVDFVGTVTENLPIIFMPGIMGSRLYNAPDPGCSNEGEIWLDIPRLVTGVSTLMLDEMGEQSQSGCDNIYTQDNTGTSGIIATHPTTQEDIYEVFIQSLRLAGYTVYIFPYDWRLDLEDSAIELDEFIDNTIGPSKVVLIGHSMGGLLAREYVLDSARAQKIDKVITVGTPYWGAPKIARYMRSGELPFNDLRLPLLSQEVWQVLRNSPGSMEILPSEAWFDQLMPYYYDDFQPISTYSETLDFFVAKDQNAGLLDQATLFHSGNGNPETDFDDFRNNLHVPYYALYATHNTNTFGGIREYPCWLWGTCWDWVYFLPGDETVPAISARLRGNQGDWSGDAALCEYRRGSITNDHFNLMSDPSVVSDIFAVLSGDEPLNCVLSSNADYREMQSDEYEPTILVSMWGDARVSVIDNQGRFTGVTADGWVINDIPLASIDAGMGGTFVGLPITSTYTLTLSQLADQPIKMNITNFRAMADEEVFTPYERAGFVEIPSAISGTATIALDYSAGLDSLQVEVDLNSDGVTDQVITPTAVLDQQAIQDMVPPTTTITVEGAQDGLGFYSGAITVTLAATDTPEGNATGVHKTEYSLDDGATWLEYTGPLELIAEDTPVFLARSVDRGGNQEYPFAEKRLRANIVYLPSLQR